MMNALTGHPECSIIDTPITSVHHKQHPWDVNFLDKIRGAMSSCGCLLRIK